MIGPHPGNEDAWFRVLRGNIAMKHSPWLLDMYIRPYVCLNARKMSVDELSDIS